VSADVGFGSFRFIRGLRMFRVLRIIRVMRFFRDMRLMVCMILQSLWSLSWALLLLVIIMYLFTVLFMQGAILHLRHASGTVDPETRDGLSLWYGSINETMYTLLASITGGVDWIDATRCLEDVSPFYRFLFAVYVVFVVVGVLNVLTGIFVERASELSGLDKDLVIHSEIGRNEAFLDEMKELFIEADVDGSGSISWQEFRDWLQNPRVKAYLATQQLDASDARTLFDMLRVKDTEEISVDEFIVGCMRLKGLARSVELVAVLQETRAIHKQLRSMMRNMDNGLTCTPSETLGSLNGQLRMDKDLWLNEIFED